MPEKEVQKVKITGALWTFRNILGIIKDILTIILLIILIGGAITLITVVPSLIKTVNTLPDLMNTLQSGGPEALMQEFQNDVNSGNWDAALSKLDAFETASGMMDLPPEAQQMLQQLKQAVTNKDQNAVNQILSQMDTSETNQKTMPDYRKVNPGAPTYG
jgi:predicted PurR-regulated permease PerM